MISQKCPKCYSKRIRRGYCPTPIWLKFLFRFHLLCDNCNWEFTGFAVPGTVSSRPTRKQKKSTQFKAVENETELGDEETHSGIDEGLIISDTKKIIKKKKKIKVKI